jgi:hypothetical protein
MVASSREIRARRRFHGYRLREQPDTRQAISSIISW